MCADGEATRFDVPAGLEAVVVVPAGSVRTEEARAALPAEVPMDDAVFNVGARLAARPRAGQGRVGPRGPRPARPRSTSRAARTCTPRRWSLVERAQELGALGATISGAGPTVLFWTHYEQTGGVVEALRRAAPDAEIRRVPFEPQGAEVREL